MKTKIVGFIVVWDENDNCGLAYPQCLRFEPNAPEGWILGCTGGSTNPAHMFTTRKEAREAIRKQHKYWQLWDKDNDDSGMMKVLPVQVEVCEVKP